MLHTILDIETTGLDITRDTVLAFGYLTLNDDFQKVVDGDILYYYQEGQRESHPKALEVHGLTTPYLRQYESDYTKNVQKLFKIIKKGSLIGHNSNGYDLPIIKRFLQMNAYGDVDWFESFDTMNIYKPVFGSNYHAGRVSLVNLIKELKIPEGGIPILQKHYYGNKDIRFVSHDATYDVTATLVAFLEAKRRGYV